VPLAADDARQLAQLIVTVLPKARPVDRDPAHAGTVLHGDLGSSVSMKELTEKTVPGARDAVSGVA
jgi:hypothetical protein